LGTAFSASQFLRLKDSRNGIGSLYPFCWIHTTLKTRCVKPERITGMLILDTEDLYGKLIGDDVEVREMRGAVRKWLEGGGC